MIKKPSTMIYSACSSSPSSDDDDSKSSHVSDIHELKSHEVSVYNGPKYNVLQVDPQNDRCFVLVDHCEDNWPLPPRKVSDISGEVDGETDSVWSRIRRKSAENQLHGVLTSETRFYENMLGPEQVLILDKEITLTDELIAVPKIMIKIEKEDPETLNSLSVVGEMYLDELAISIRDYDNKLILNPIPVVNKEIENAITPTPSITTSSPSAMPTTVSINCNSTTSSTTQYSSLTHDSIATHNRETGAATQQNDIVHWALTLQAAQQSDDPKALDSIPNNYNQQSNSPQQSPQQETLNVIEPFRQTATQITPQYCQQSIMPIHVDMYQPQIISQQIQQPISQLNQQQIRQPISLPNQHIEQPIYLTNQQQIQQQISHPNQQQIQPPISHPNQQQIQQPISHPNQQQIQQPNQQQNQQPISHPNQQQIQQPISHPNQQQIQQPNQQQIQQPISYSNQQPISYQNQQPTIHPNQHIEQSIYHTNQQKIQQQIQQPTQQPMQQTPQYQQITQTNVAASVQSTPNPDNSSGQIVESESIKYTMKAISRRDPKLTNIQDNNQEPDDIIYMKCVLNYKPSYDNDGNLIAEPSKANPLQANWIHSLKVPGISQNTKYIVVSCNDSQVKHLVDTFVRVKDSNNRGGDIVESDIIETAVRVERHLERNCLSKIPQGLIEVDQYDVATTEDEVDDTAKEEKTEQESNGANTKLSTDCDSNVTLQNENPAQLTDVPVLNNYFENPVQNCQISENPTSFLHADINGEFVNVNSNVMSNNGNTFLPGSPPSQTVVSTLTVGHNSYDIRSDQDCNDPIVQDSAKVIAEAQTDADIEQTLSAGIIVDHNNVPEIPSPERRLRELLSNEHLLSFHQDSFCGSSTPRSISPLKAYVRESFVDIAAPQPQQPRAVHRQNVPSIVITSSATPRHQPLSSRGRYSVSSGADDPVVVRTVAGPISESPGIVKAMLPRTPLTSDASSLHTQPSNRTNQHQHGSNAATGRITGREATRVEGEEVERQRTHASGKNIILLELLCHVFRSKSANLSSEIDSIFVQTFNKLSKELLDQKTYYNMLSCLKSYNNEKSIKNLYANLKDIVNDKFILDFFTIFLKPAEAKELGCYLEYLEFEKIPVILGKLAKHVHTHSQIFSKLVKAFLLYSQMEKNKVSGSLEQLKDTIKQLLKSNTCLLEEIMWFFFNDSPPASMLTDFEQVDMSDKLRIYSDIEEVELIDTEFLAKGNWSQNIDSNRKLKKLFKDRRDCQLVETDSVTSSICLDHYKSKMPSIATTRTVAGQQSSPGDNPTMIEAKSQIKIAFDSSMKTGYPYATRKCMRTSQPGAIGSIAVTCSDSDSNISTCTSRSSTVTDEDSFYSDDPVLVQGDPIIVDDTAATVVVAEDNDRTLTPHSDACEMQEMNNSSVDTVTAVADIKDPKDMVIGDVVELDVTAPGYNHIIEEQKTNPQFTVEVGHRSDEVEQPIHQGLQFAPGRGKKITMDQECHDFNEDIKEEDEYEQEEEEEYLEDGQGLEEGDDGGEGLEVDCENEEGTYEGEELGIEDPEGLDGNLEEEDSECSFEEEEEEEIEGNFVVEERIEGSFAVEEAIEGEGLEGSNEKYKEQYEDVEQIHEPVIKSITLQDNAVQQKENKLGTVSDIPATSANLIDNKVKQNLKCTSSSQTQSTFTNNMQTVVRPSVKSIEQYENSEDNIIKYIMDNEGNNMTVLKKISILLNRSMQHVSDRYDALCGFTVMHCESDWEMNMRLSAQKEAESKAAKSRSHSSKSNVP